MVATSLSHAAPRTVLMSYFDTLDEFRDFPLDALYNTAPTAAQFWDIDDPSPQSEVLDEATLSAKLDSLVSLSPPARNYASLLC